MKKILVIDGNSIINRAFYGLRILQTAEGRYTNAIYGFLTMLHKAVKEEVVRLLASAPQLVAIDAIGLFEGGLAELCHTTLAITAPEEVRVARLMARDALTQEQALARIRAQKSQEWFVARCDHHLHNEGSMEAFQENCITLYKKIILN